MTFKMLLLLLGKLLGFPPSEAQTRQPLASLGLLALGQPTRTLGSATRLVPKGDGLASLTVGTGPTPTRFLLLLLGLVFPASLGFLFFHVISS